MKRLLCFALLLMMISALAFGQPTKVPTCNGWSTTVPSVPIDTASNSSNCTDYFGVANWANSPLPSGAIAGYTIMLGGSGYTAPTITVSDPAGSGVTTATATVDPVSGAITAITGGLGGSGYIAPVVTITDPSPTAGGAIVSATIGAPFVGGMPKFQAADTLGVLGGLPLAVPDTTTFPGSDFYVIGLQQYTQVLHSSLPPTTLRGYVQLNTGTPTASNPTGAPPAQSYLGPVILAQKGRPVRVLFKNMLPTGPGGNLFIPVDTTYMGAGIAAAGSSNTENRATLHLHGGNTPWISDGTTMQWTAPAGEAGTARGESVHFVPDMWFDATGNFIAACAGQPTCNAVPGATNDPGPGNLTFFWTNQQGGRLMFYHDHAYGITRLNVYAGEAAGYLLLDPTEEDKLAAATVPGTVGATTPADVTHLIPLVIQDKTFVPSSPQLAAEDPTWAGNFGATALSATGGNGDLWFPHVYIPNQNPADPGGGNAFGRWDYGAWFFPPMTTLSAAGPGGANNDPHGGVTIPCTSAAFPGLTLAPAAANNYLEGCGITPNPSGTPEGFMDTPLVNGKAYPVMHVAPAAYRFQILSAGNDRSWNLQLYVADATQNNTEVAMVPAVPPAAGAALPLCSQMNPITNTTLGIGLATALLDGTGNPINGTGLPTGCWPFYGSIPGIPPKQTMWAADGRAGGAPDPTKAGPPFIQIGTEGGLLPAPVVIPSTPTGYEWNPRSITITNVGVHGLWLGPAERADVIVDFTQFAGKTLILYNDAPTPAPAFDSRNDYFTGDGDQATIGGAPNTQPGFGPNIRTIMQIVVDGTAPNGTPFSLAALKAAFKTTTAGAGLFASTQPTTIVPEAAYGSAYNATFPNTFARISDNTITFTPITPFAPGTTAPCTTSPVAPATCINMDQKAIQELFTVDYGRMNATLGTELPFTNFLTQTTIPLGYADPATEIIKDTGTQIWKISHNGVDTHFIHFHLVNVQVLNRVGWDGSLRPIEENELGWKDTVRMNPLEDIFVALQANKQSLPFPLPNSFRLMDVTMPAGTDPNFTGVNPFTNNPDVPQNAVQNFGWEYVWHCHILGHEENDMMRPIVFQVPPPSPSNLSAAQATTGGVQLTWTDNSASETSFEVQRDTDPTFPAPATIPLTAVQSGQTTNVAGEGTTWGEQVTIIDNASLTAGTTYYYQVRAVDDAFKPPFTQIWNASPALLSGFSNTATILPVPIAGIAPTTLAFGNVLVGTSTTLLANGSQAQVTISNTGTATLTINNMLVTGANAPDFTATPCTSVAPGATCVFTVTFAPTAVGPESAVLTINSNDPARPNLPVTLTGTGISNTITTINAPAITYGANGVVTVSVASTPNPFAVTGTVTLSVDGGAAINGTLVGGSATFNLTAPAAGVHTLSANYATQGFFQASSATGTLTVNGAPLTITASNGAMVYGGAVPTITPIFAGFVNGDTNLTALSTQPTCSTTATPTSPIGSYPSTCTGAVAANYTITYVAGTVTVTAAPLTITASSGTMVYGGAVPTITPIFAGFVNGDTNLTALSTQPTCSTTATPASPVGSYPSTCTGAVAANYTITNVAGTVTVTSAPLTITASNGTMVYGGAVPAITPSFVGFVNGDTNLTALSAQPICSTTATPTSNVGNYPSTCTGAVAANYTISYIAGSVTVTKAPLLITASNGAMTYGGAVPAITAIFSGFVNGQTSSVLSPQPICSTTATSTSIVGSYPSTCTGAAATNYSITYAAGTVTVSKATSAIAIVLHNPNPSIVGQIVTVNFAVTPQFSGTATGSVTVTASTGESCTGAVTGAGSCTLTFMTGGSRTLTATYSGDGNFLGSVSAPVTHGVAGVSLSTTALLFGDQLVGTNSATQTITLSNVGSIAITGIAIANSNTLDYNFTTTCGATLRVGRSCNIVVRFRPTLAGVRTGAITITDSDPTPQIVSLTGTGIAPVNSVTPPSLAFGTQARGTTSAPQTATVANTGTAPLTVTSMALGGANAGQFALSSNTCAPFPATLAPGATCTVNVSFRPTSAGAKSAVLNVRVATPATNASVTLGGTGR